MLIDQYGHLDLNELLLPLAELDLFPSAEERVEWAGASDALSPQWVAQAEQYLSFTWPALTVERYLNYNRKGDNLSFLFPFFERRSVLGAFVLAECIEGKGRFLDQILNGIFCICEETTWMTPFDLANFKEVVPSPTDRIVDLSCSETGALLAWVHNLLKKQLDAISPRVCARIETEISQRLMEPYMEHDDYWWMGFVETPVVNNWNPWCNSNMLVCFLLLESNSEARCAAILKIMRSLDVFIRKYPPDGCCQEGPMYWGAAGGGLHTCLWLLKEASAGEIDIFSEPVVQLIGQYIYKVHIHDDYFVDFADGDARVAIGMQAYNYGLSIGDQRLVQLGANVEKTIPRKLNWFNMYNCLQDLFIECESTEFKAPYIREAWMEHSQVMTARESEGSEQGLYLAAKGGTNNEPHNHNDVGNFIVYADGLPVFIDLGTEEYTAKTFSAERYEIWYL
ncbi:heparinase [Paenibacillus psychroresistens]|uniref:Heparinase n=1 Tax=Paenibacillus psychroresistens TaxID=1778678 RepID=A0A6B8RR06_9BACL|nr:heparinase II/III family protein [Paenibacillus psychroresistens]QGQ98142.1 heparinase [Paenibacillus psychroresistens]